MYILLTDTIGKLNNTDVAMATYHLCIVFATLILMILSERATGNRGGPEKTIARAKVDNRRKVANGSDPKELKSSDLMVIMLYFI